MNTTDPQKPFRELIEASKKCAYRLEQSSWALHAEELRRKIRAAEAALPALVEVHSLGCPVSPTPLGLTQAELDAGYLAYHKKVTDDYEQATGRKWPYKAANPISSP